MQQYHYIKSYGKIQSLKRIKKLGVSIERGDLDKLGMIDQVLWVGFGSAGVTNGGQYPSCLRKVYPY
jgi:hypothetical protein